MENRLTEWKEKFEGNLYADFIVDGEKLRSYVISPENHYWGYGGKTFHLKGASVEILKLFCELDARDMLLTDLLEDWYDELNMRTEEES